MPAEVRDQRHHGHEEHARVSSAALGFFSADNRHDSLFISNYLDPVRPRRLKRVPGVGNVIIFGERRFAMRLWLDPRQAGRTRADRRRRRRTRCASRTSGGRRAASATQPSCRRSDVSAQRARAGPPHRGASQFEDIVVKAGKDGALVRVKDVGRVELGAERLLVARCGSRASKPRASASSSCRRPTRWRRSAACSAEMERLERDVPARPRSGGSHSTTSASSASRSSRC